MFGVSAKADDAATSLDEGAVVDCERGFLGDRIALGSRPTHIACIFQVASRATQPSPPMHVSGGVVAGWRQSTTGIHGTSRKILL